MDVHALTSQPEAQVSNKGYIVLINHVEWTIFTRLRGRRWSILMKEEICTGVCAYKMHNVQRVDGEIWGGYHGDDTKRGGILAVTRECTTVYNMHMTTWKAAKSLGRIQMCSDG